MGKIKDMFKIKNQKSLCLCASVVKIFFVLLFSSTHIFSQQVTVDENALIKNIKSCFWTLPVFPFHSYFIFYFYLFVPCLPPRSIIPLLLSLWLASIPQRDGSSQVFALEGVEISGKKYILKLRMQYQPNS